jgi:hypothetical protein
MVIGKDYAERFHHETPWNIGMLEAWNIDEFEKSRHFRETACR